MDTFRERLESGHFTMEELYSQNDRLIDAETLLRKADEQEIPPSPEIEGLMGG